MFLRNTLWVCFRKRTRIGRQARPLIQLVTIPNLLPIQDFYRHLVPSMLMRRHCAKTNIRTNLSYVYLADAPWSPSFVERSSPRWAIKHTLDFAKGAYTQGLPKDVVPYSQIPTLVLRHFGRQPLWSKTRLSSLALLIHREHQRPQLRLRTRLFIASWISRLAIHGIIISMLDFHRWQFLCLCYGCTSEWTVNVL